MKNKIKLLALIILIAALFTACTAAPATVEPTIVPVGEKNEFKVAIDDQDCFYEFSLTKLDETTATVTFCEVYKLETEPQPLTLKNVLTYSVVYTKNDDDTYTAAGTVTSASVTVEGENAKTFISEEKQRLGFSKYDVLYKKTLDGEKLTDEIDIAWFNRKIDDHIKINFTLDTEKNKLNLYKWERSYINWLGNWTPYNYTNLEYVIDPITDTVVY